jgi:signal peptidase
MKLLLKIIFKTLKVLSTVLVILALIIIISQRVTNNKLRLFGYGVYTVISESMLTEYEIGDMFLAKEIKEEDINVGDDIVYIGEVDSYKDKVITHRVIRKEDKTIITKGINNDLEDPPIQYKQVYGRVSARLLALSLFSKLMNNNVLFYLIIFVPFTILIFLDTKDLFKEKKKDDENEENLVTPVNNTEPVTSVPSTVPTTSTPSIVQETSAPAPAVPNTVPITNTQTTVPATFATVDNNTEVKENQ